MWRSLARTVNRLDGVGEAWLAGRFGRGQAKKIADARANRRVSDVLGPFVPIFVAQAESLDCADFAQLVDLFRQKPRKKVQSPKFKTMII